MGERREVRARRQRLDEGSRPGDADGARARLRGGVDQHDIPFASEMPHGGFKNSGYGKDLSSYGLDDYTRVKHVMSSLD